MIKIIRIILVFSFLLLNTDTAEVFAGSKQISIVTLDFPPISNEKIDNYGFIGDVFISIFEPYGYKVDIKMHPWARSYEICKKGKDADAIFPSIYTKDRENWFIFSDPILSSGYVLITRKDTGITTFNSLNEFKKKTIGVLRKGVTGSILDSSNFKKEEGKNFEINIKKLLKKRFDLITGEYLAITNIIERKFSDQKDQLIYISPSISKVNFHLMISKKSPNAQALQTVCNKGSLKIKQNGTLSQLKLKHGIKEFD